MLKSLSSTLILRGLLAVAVGIVALAWPGITVLALVILFAIYAFIAAGMEAVKAFSSERAGPVVGHLLLGLVDIGAGVIALALPGPTALVLVLLVGAWATIGGLVEIYAGFEAGATAANYAATIDWGDGMTTPGTVQITQAGGPAYRLLARSPAATIMPMRASTR